MTLRNIASLSLTFFLGIMACSDTQNRTVKRAPANKTKTTILQNIFAENSIGVVYLDTTKNNNYTLTIRFPNFTLPDSILKRDTTNYAKDVPIYIAPQTIILFDEAGELTTLKNVSECISKFWCENDGGDQYEPTYTLTIRQENFKRPLQIKNSKVIGKLSCFAIINYNASQFKSFYPINGSENKNVIMRGRLSSDYSNNAYKVPIIYKYYDRNVEITADEDDAGMANYCISLRAINSRQDFELGCCGP